MEVYSNLSLQILNNNKDIKYYYDEYLSFNNSISNKIKIIHIDYYFKPIFEIKLIKHFLEKFKDSSELYLITNNLNNFQVINQGNLLLNLIQSYKLTYISLESVLGTSYMEDCSIKNLKEFQFPYNYIQQKKLKDLYNKIYANNKLPKIKVICVDFDNTLFEGVIGELDSIDDVFKNSAPIFYIFHQFLKKIKQSGVLLCLVTKNNQSEIELFFKKNKTPLKLEDFIIIESNWDKKSINIDKISNQLNLDTNTFLFIDDSDFELEEVRSNIPGIRTIKFIKDFKYFKEQFLNNSLFNKKNITAEDLNKTSLYKEEFKRKSQFKKTNLIDDKFNLDLFKLLKIELDFKINNDIDLERVSQMSEKTNQFNLNKLELTKEDLLKLIKQGYNIYTCNSKDKYGDYGVIGYMIFNKSNQIFNYVISCRALSRHIEFKFLDYCIKKQKIKNDLTIFFKKTKRNQPANLFLNLLKEYYGEKNKIIRIKNVN